MKKMVLLLMIICSFTPAIHAQETYTIKIGFTMELVMDIDDEIVLISNIDNPLISSQSNAIECADIIKTASNAISITAAAGGVFTVVFSDPTSGETASVTIKVNDPNISSTNPNGSGPRPPRNYVCVLVDGNYVVFDQHPSIDPVSNRVMIPLRSVSEVLGAEVDWLAESQTVLISKDATIIQVSVNSETGYVNNQSVGLDQPPVNRNGRVSVPLRFFSEAFNVKVNWDPVGQIVQLSK